MSKCVAWNRDFAEAPHVRGFLHSSIKKAKAGIVLTHGAGGNCNSLLLKTLCDVFADKGLAAVRCNLPYRQKRPSGPPHPAGAAMDRLGLDRAITALRESVKGPIFVGGSSYGGRQSSMLAAQKAGAADGLLLLSYPLHPPGKPESLRTEHFADISCPSLFAHGTKDVFGSPEEMRQALQVLKGPTELELIDGAAHGIVQSKDKLEKAQEISERIAEKFLQLARLIS